MDWKQIKAEYIAGGTSYRKLCAKYGVSRTTLEKKARDEKWTDLRRQAQGKAEAKIIDAVSDKEARKANKIIDVADKLLDKIAELMEDMVVDTQSLKQLTSALKDLKEIKGYKSASDMKEQEARIAKLQKEAERQEESNDVTVTIGSDVEEYSK